MEPSEEYPAEDFTKKNKYPAEGSSSDQLKQNLLLQICSPPFSPLSVRKDTLARKNSPSWYSYKPMLRFINSPPPVIFTHTRIEADDGSMIAVELVNAATETRVTSGSLSSMKLNIVPLDADFTEEFWTADEFNRKIVHTREGKRQELLAGHLMVTLKNGIGVIEDVAFTDNSSWLESKKFRLGVKTIKEGEVMEARTEAFVCKDHLGETSSYGIEKQHPPYPENSVWSLEGIPKNGVEASRLAEEGIHTVLELRRCMAMNPDAFHRILGTLVSKKTLATIVSHAMRCDRDDGKYYAYNVQAQGAFLLFNDFYELEKVSLNGVTTQNYKELTFKQKELIDKLKFEAYKNVTRFIVVDKCSFVYHPQDSLSQSSDKSKVLPQDPSPKYDVVIRYDDEDESNRFISHLCAAFCQKGISVPEEFDEVPECGILITFVRSGQVSSNYPIFLNLLNREARGIPQMFYRLSPSSSICNKTNRERYSLQNKRMWSTFDVLKEAPDYILTNKTESELMDAIVRDALKELCSSDKENMIGMDTQVEEVLSLLCIEYPDVRRIGIWGTAGIGKTTVAEKIFRRISVQYKTCVFLKDIHEQVEENGQVTVREEFLSKLLEVEPSMMRNSDINPCFLRSRLQCKRVLVILDDVNDFRDVETFLENLNYFGPGSRIIITSRNRSVFGQTKIDHIYEVKPLDMSTSLLLLDTGTLESVTSMSTADYRKQSLELVKFANGNPEVLKYLKNRSRGEWDQLLQEVLQTSPICIPRILRSCYGLVENEINIFLDIACFFRRMDKDNVAMLLDGCGFFAHVGFRSLVDRSLLTISYNLVDMQRFIQATGREIVRQESPDVPGKRSRLWNPEDIMDVFLYDNGTSTIEGIFFDMSKQKFDANPNIFENMWNLRLLKFYCSEVMGNHRVSLLRGLKYLPSRLRLLHWEYYPLSSLPRSFDPRNLVELNLPSSCAKKLWKGKKNLEKLKKMRLSYSYQLIKLPRLSSAPNLELLDLEGCNSLLSISQSVSNLKKLVFLNLKNCSKLESIPSTVDLESLEVLNLSGCSKLEIFPEVSPNVKELY